MALSLEDILNITVLITEIACNSKKPTLSQFFLPSGGSIMLRKTQMPTKSLGLYTHKWCISISQRCSNFKMAFADLTVQVAKKKWILNICIIVIIWCRKQLTIFSSLILWIRYDFLYIVALFYDVLWRYIYA